MNSIFGYFQEFEAQRGKNLLLQFWLFFTNLRPAIFLNLRPERSALFARFYPIATNLSPEIVPREPVVAVKV